MPRYVTLGKIPRKRHTQFRKPEGTLYHEQVFGTKGFSGIASILYHVNPPTQVEAYHSEQNVRPELLEDEPLRHRHLKTRRFDPEGDPITGRTPLLVNDDVSFGFCVPAEPMSYFYKNADGDDLLFIQEGSGRLETMFGTLPFGPGDYLVVPRGTIYRLVPSPALTPQPPLPRTGEGEQSSYPSPVLGGGARGGGDGLRMLVIEAASAIEVPRRYRNEYGQLLEHSPYCERDIRVPELLETHEEAGKYEVHIKARGRITAYEYPFHPLDVAGWDGFVYPWAFNIGDFEPITGSIHQPPPVHQTFEAHNFVVCSFCPRMLDYHPDAIPVPYNHSNLESDEVLFYVNDKFGSRKGIEVGSITLHPSGLPHGPQPGAVEASLGKTRTEELAVMVDTFRPLKLTRAAAALEDTEYPFSWLPGR